ncbi:phage holin [Staphylococcus saprophyticus]|uniref:phage holin n=1 Tax=Staphylococcus saprophyticus TaxID=29385 RepID=UPI000CD2C445|nr:phage holin [Staphylococcus saprophyticus]PNZ69630.1 PTS mannose transporter subunit IID [Staphylococcus saprophyticus]
MNADKLKQWIGLIGGMLSALYLALKASGIELAVLDPDKLNAWQNFATTLIPFVIAVYGVYKNTFIIKHSAKAQEEYLKEEGLK